MLYEFELDHNAVKATKNISWAKGKGFGDHSKVIGGFKKLNIQHIIFPKLMLYEFQLDHNSVESKTNLCIISLNWTIMLRKQPKTFFVQKVKA